MALSIAGSDSGGGAGIQADLACFRALGVHGASALTALTAQTGWGISGVHPVPPGFVAEQIAAVCSALEVRAAKTGMLHGPATVRAVAGALGEFAVNQLVVDPVLASTSGTPLLSPEGRRAMVEELFPLALVVTPNLSEAGALLGEVVGSIAAMRSAARRIQAMGPVWVLVKGGHLPGRPVDVLYGRGELLEIEGERIDAPGLHGTGCVLSAALAAFLAQGASVPEAVVAAKRHVTGAIAGCLELGPSGGCVDPAWNLRDQPGPD